MFGTKSSVVSSTMDAIYCRGPLQVTIAWIALYYCFLFFQGMSKYYIYLKEKTDGKKVNMTKIKYFGGSNDRLILTGDRTAGNMVEQSIPFLASLWLCAMFHSPAEATKWGWYWLGSRVIYPVCFHLGMPYLLLSSTPGYICIFFLVYPVGMKAFE